MSLRDKYREYVHVYERLIKEHEKDGHWREWLKKYVTVRKEYIDSIRKEPEGREKEWHKEFIKSERGIRGKDEKVKRLK